ncbi:MAG: TraB/GumN family protein [Burkholderiales bacterium]
MNRGSIRFPVARIIRAAALLLLVFAGHAAAAEYDRGLLWRIEKGGSAPSYLFGTVHVDDPRVIALPEPVRRRFDAAAAFTMEVVFDPAAAAQLARRMIYADGRDLEQAAGKALFARVAAAGVPGVPPEALRLFKPWAIAVLLIMPQPQGEVLDVMLMQRARAQGKPVHELETVDEQVAVFESVPEHEQLLMLRYTVDHLAAARSRMREVVDAWLARDLGAIARISDRVESADPEVLRFNERFRALLLDRRNARMVERMQPQLAAGGAFIAVGALHLHGTQGLLALLAGRGYRVTAEY